MVRPGAAIGVCVTVALLLGISGCSSDSESENGGKGGSAGKSGAGGSSGSSGSSGSGGAAPGASPMIGGCAVFPPDDDWNVDVSAMPADDTWTERLRNMVGEVNLHPDFGAEYGLPINVVPESQPMVQIALDGYADESDPLPYPFPDPGVALIEGGDPTDCSGDCHLLVLHQGSCKLYEAYACQHSDTWHCSNEATWDLKRASYGQREKGWTSADAAGLSVTAGLLRLDEVLAGEVKHAIRFTTSCTRNNFVKPATHLAVPGSCDPDDPNSPPMGLRVRLRADFDVSGFAKEVRVILAGFKKHGMILADNGSNFYFQGETADWPDVVIEELKTISSNEFEAVQVPPLEN
jgi:hypothetical protein